MNESVRTVAFALAIIASAEVFAQAVPAGRPGQPASEPPPSAAQSVADPITPFACSGSGTIYDGSVSGYSTTGVVLNSSAGCPSIAAKLAGTSATSMFSVRDANNTQLLSVFGDGNVVAGNTSSPSARLTVFQTLAGKLGLEVSKFIDVTTSVAQDDTAAQHVAYETISTGVSNTGYIRGTLSSAFLGGAGTVANAYGQFIEVGVIAGQANTGTVSNAWGSRVVVAKNSGSITNGYGYHVKRVDGVYGYGVYVEDIAATNAYAFYSAGTNDDVYVAGKVGVAATDPAGTLDVRGTLAVSNNAANFWNFDRDVDGSLKVTDSGVERLRVLSSGTLTVAGTIHSTVGGIKFPDGSTQTTAAVGGVAASSVTAGTFGGAGGGAFSFRSPAADQVPLIVNGHASATTPRVEFKDDNGSVDLMIVKLIDQSNTERIRLAGGAFTTSFFNGGNLAVGTNSTTYKFDVVSGPTGIRLNGGDTANPFSSRLSSSRPISGMTELGKMMFTSSADEASPLGSIGWYADGTGTTRDSKLNLVVQDGGVERALVLDGSVPTGKLTWSGDAHFAGTVTGGNIKAHYQDIAEWVPANTDLAPGTVVILNPDRPNAVIQSQSAYDTTVAGVVSAQPGLSLGEEAADKEQVATMGRVRVRVDATTLPIRIGDLLVTGSKPGTAMRSEPIQIGGAAIHRPGTIIGKALEALPSGEGEILVLLSMQ